MRGQPSQIVPAIVRQAERTEAEIVAHCKAALKKSDKSSWDVADDYEALACKPFEWTQQRIADEFGTSQQNVCRFINCVALYPLASKRPSFWEAYREVDGKTNWVDKECAAVEWYTPESVLAAVREYFGGPIPLDPATTKNNRTGALRFFTAKDNGLEQDWSGPGVFVNPPYGDTVPDWCEKIHTEADGDTPIIALLPCGARFGTTYWQEHIFNCRLGAICFHRGRIAFHGAEGQKSGNPYDSAIYGFNVDCGRFAAAFSPLGSVLVVQEVLG